MAIDRQRAEQFSKQLRDIINPLSFDEGYEVFKSKLLDLISRGEIQGESLRDFINQIRSTFEPDFIKFVDRTERAYNDTLQLVNTHYNDLGIDIDRNMDRIRAIEEVNRTRLGKYKEEAVESISRTVRKGVLDGKNHLEIGDILSQQSDDAVKTYAQTLANTQVKGYGQVAKTEKARLGNVFYFEYVGIERDTTRTFCLELIRQSNPTFHIDDIRKMSNGHGLNVEYYRGGYRCFHDWEPDPFERGDEYSVSFYSKQGETKQDLQLARRTG